MELPISFVSQLTVRKGKYLDNPLGAPGARQVQKARLFLRQAEQIGHRDLDAFAANIEASLIFAKNVQFVLYDLYGENHAAWDNPICLVFGRMRNVIVHRDGSLEVIDESTESVASVSELPPIIHERHNLVNTDGQHLTLDGKNLTLVSMHFRHDNPDIAGNDAVQVVGAYIDFLERTLRNPAK